MPDDYSFHNYRAKRDFPYVEHDGQPSSLRNVFHHDKAAVTYSPYFRRMAFREYTIADPGPDNRNRLLHCIEVATIASGMARRLKVNVDLTEAIAMGHDVGKPPCGYPVDFVLDKFLNDQGGFDHAILGCQILLWDSKKSSAESCRFNRLYNMPCFEKIDLDDGRKYVASVSKELIDGISKHTLPSPDLKNRSQRYHCNVPLTVEGQLVRFADNLAYISQELDEGLRLDKSLMHQFLSYSNERELTLENGDKRSQKELNQGINGKPDLTFLQNVFGFEMGPRLLTMIKRIEDYNKKRLRNNEISFIQSSEMSADFQVPILEFDPVLDFINDKIWEFIMYKIDKNPKVTSRAERNEARTKKALEILLSKPPTEGKEHEEFEKRKCEVMYYYKGLSEEKVHRRAIAHYIATLTDRQISDLIGSTREEQKRDFYSSVEDFEP